jgi:hypothetical protein
MNGYLSRRSEAQMLEETRSRAAEFYFNGTCLVARCSTGDSGRSHFSFIFGVSSPGDEK